MEINEIVNLVDKWVQEVQDQGFEERSLNGEWEAWDDVKDVPIPISKVREARAEEVKYMMDRGMWVLRPIQESWERLGKGPVSVKWVDTNKGTEEEMLIRSRLVARDFKGKDKGRDDLFAGTPPLEAKRLSISRAATRRKDGRYRKLLFIDVRKAHCNPLCEEDVYITLPEECKCPPGMCGKLVHWLYGFRPAASAWERLYAGKLEGVGFVRGKSCGVVFYHPERDVSLVVHGDDFTFCGVEEELQWIKGLMAQWFEIKVRGILGGDEGDVRQIVLLGRVITWKREGIEYEADPRHRKAVLDYFGLGEGSKELTTNGEKEDEVHPGDEVELEPREATEYRGVAAKVNYLSLDCPDLQFPVKTCSREMANPSKGS